VNFGLSLFERARPAPSPACCGEQNGLSIWCKKTHSATEGGEPNDLSTGFQVVCWASFVSTNLRCWLHRRGVGWAEPARLRLIWAYKLTVPEKEARIFPRGAGAEGAALGEIEEWLAWPWG